MPPTESSFTTDNPWDRLSDFFDTSKDEDEIPAGAADNILIAWPVFFRFIEAHDSHVAWEARPRLWLRRGEFRPTPQHRSGAGSPASTPPLR